LKPLNGTWKTRPMSHRIARFFDRAADFRQWLVRHHRTEPELWVGFRRKGIEPAGMDYATAVDVALCYGWIDGVRKAIDGTSYTNRFTPRQAVSIWSRVNIARVERLIARGEMHPSGMEAYGRRDPAKSGIYSFEQRPESFAPELERRFKAHPAAWTHFCGQPPGYRRLAIWWVSSAKREQTRVRRLSQLVDASSQGMRVGVLFGQTGAIPTPTRKTRTRPRKTGR